MREGRACETQLRLTWIFCAGPEVTLPPTSVLSCSAAAVAVCPGDDDKPARLIVMLIFCWPLADSRLLPLVVAAAGEVVTGPEGNVGATEAGTGSGALPGGGMKSYTRRRFSANQLEGVGPGAGRATDITRLRERERAELARAYLGCAPASASFPGVPTTQGHS